MPVVDALSRSTASSSRAELRLGPSGSRRIRAVDATRGTAMLFVCASHFASVYLSRVTGGIDAGTVWMICQIASPTFVLISGVILGFLAETQRQDFERTRLRLIDRGIFLLTVAHLLIALSQMLWVRSWVDAFSPHYITDTIGISVIVGALTIRQVSAGRRVAIGAVIYLVDWLMILTWHPHTPLMLEWYDVLVGSPPPWPSGISFALLPWFSLYLAGSALGEKVARAFADGRARQMEMTLFKGGAISVAAALTIHYVVALIVRETLEVGSPSYHIVRHLASFWQKYPPAPIYLAFYVGAGLMVMAFVMRLTRARPNHIAVRWVTLLGENSLFTFVSQYFVYYMVVLPLNLRYTHAWPLYFLATLALITAGSLIWSKRFGNKYLTVGFPLLVAWIRSGAMVTRERRS